MNYAVISPLKIGVVAFFLTVSSIATASSPTPAAPEASKPVTTAAPETSKPATTAHAHNGAKHHQVVSLYQALAATTTDPIAIAEKLLKEFPGYLVSFDADVQRGHVFYEYDVVQLEKKQVVEIEIEAATGKQVQVEVKDIDEDYPQTAEEFSNVISFLSVWKNAEKTFGKKLSKMEIDQRRTHFIYRGEILDQYLKSLFRINAKNGQLIPTR